MAEAAETGGVIRFEYPKNYRTAPVKLEMQKNIEKGYEDYYKRKKKENFWKIIMWIILGILVIAFGAYVILKS